MKEGVRELWMSVKTGDMEIGGRHYLQRQEGLREDRAGADNPVHSL